MNFSILVLLIIGINCTKAYHKVSATTEHSKIIHRSLRETTTNSSNVQIPERKISLTDILYSKQNLTKLEGLEKNTKKEVSNRKSKILRSLAYLAGLTVGNLTNAASTDVKTYTKFPSLNVDTSPLATIYNPYPYLTYPYIFATPVGFYPPLLDLLRLQSINGLQNVQPSSLNLLDNKIIGQLKDEYGEEAQKIENIKMPNNEQSKNTEDTEAEENQNEEGKKEVNAKQSNTLKNIVQDNSFTLALRVANTTNTTAGNMTHTDNSTQSPSFYYGGYPQNIHVIDFTTKTYEPYYHSYGYGNYDLPYNTPIPNFHLDKTYINYPVDHYPYVGHYPHVDHYPGQFHQQIPQYDPNDFNRFSYTPDNIPSFANNDFKPIV